MIFDCILNTLDKRRNNIRGVFEDDFSSEKVSTSFASKIKFQIAIIFT